MYILFSPFYSWGKCFRDICNCSHSLKVWLTQIACFLHLTTPPFTSEKVMLLKALIMKLFPTKFCRSKKWVCFLKQPFSLSLQILGIHQILTFPHYEKPSTLDHFCPLLEFWFWNLMVQDILQWKMLKMIIEAYSNHYIL